MQVIKIIEFVLSFATDASPVHGDTKIFLIMLLKQLVSTIWIYLISESLGNSTSHVTDFADSMRENNKLIDSDSQWILNKFSQYLQFSSTGRLNKDYKNVKTMRTSALLSQHVRVLFVLECMTK